MSHPVCGHTSTDTLPNRLNKYNLVCRIPATGQKTTHQSRCVIRGLSKKFVQYVYKNFILQILGYINVVPFKILPI